ncbi:MAG: hypothetical protein KGZ70_13155 [Hydrogenophaga sp.]|nr:hypothetical protein [Hydrogenophaga sp.]
MSVPYEQLVTGAAFRFKNGIRRITGMRGHVGTGFMVDWEYADGLPRRRQTGSLWSHSFRMQALELVLDPSTVGEQRQLLPSQRIVACLDQPVVITIKSRCPAKWVMVDMETGQLWGHDGKTFQRLTDQQAGEVAAVASLACKGA